MEAVGGDELHQRSCKVSKVVDLADGFRMRLRRTPGELLCQDVAARVLTESSLSTKHAWSHAEVEPKGRTKFPKDGARQASLH